MKHVSKVRTTRWAAVLAFALLLVPVAQAKPISFPQHGSQATQANQGETALGLKADALRWQAQAKTYAYSQEIRSESLARMRDAKALSQSMAGPAPISENSPVELRLQPTPQTTVQATGRSFAWRDAGIGAGLAALLTSMLLLGASSVLGRKRIAHA